MTTAWWNSSSSQSAKRRSKMRTKPAVVPFTVVCRRIWDAGVPSGGGGAAPKKRGSAGVCPGEVVQDGRICIERVNEPFLAAGGSGDQFRAGIERAVALGWLWRHERGYLRCTDSGIFVGKPDHSKLARPSFLRFNLQRANLPRICE